MKVKNYFVFFILLLLSLTGKTFPVSDAKALSRTFVDISKKATKSVVFIKSESKNRQYQQNPFDFFNDDFFKHFFGRPRSPEPSRKIPPQVTAGSGFIISNNGYILTNNHVVQDSEKITVILNTGEEKQATIIGTDPRTDLALIKIDAKDLDFLVFGDSDELEVGELVLAIGSPFELRSTVTLGIVSAKGRQNLRITDFEDFIQTDASTNPGNSGGPLITLDGKVVGINTAIASAGGSYSFGSIGVGFAIPSNMAKYVVTQLKENGSVNRGYLGIVLQEVDKEMAEAFNLEKSEGVLISEVTKNSAAEKAGLKEGDVIVELNEKPIKNINSFRNDIASLKPNTTVNLKILRDKKYRNVKVTLGTYPTDAIAKQSDMLGIEVSSIKNLSPSILNKWRISPDAEGIVITSVKRNSMAERAGLKPGMVILKINQKSVKSVEDFKEALSDEEVKEKKRILLQVRYFNMTKFIFIKMD
jgi:serine protease Do